MRFMYFFHYFQINVYTNLIYTKYYFRLNSDEMRYDCLFSPNLLYIFICLVHVFFEFELQYINQMYIDQIPAIQIHTVYILNIIFLFCSRMLQKKKK